MKRQNSWLSTSELDWAITSLTRSIPLLLSANLKNVFTCLQHESATVSIPVVCFVQSNPCTVHMMQQWVPDAAWAPVPGGVASDLEFLRHCDLAASLNEPWVKLTIF